jgi:hypothetical protein
MLWLAKAIVIKLICQINYYYFTRITRWNITMLLTQDPIGAFLEDALAKEPTKDDYEISEDMYDAFDRFCQHHTSSGPGFDKFSEDLRKKHGLKKGRKMIDKKKKTIWEECKLIKWKNPDDPLQKTLESEESEGAEQNKNNH